MLKQMLSNPAYAGPKESKGEIVGPARLACADP